MWNSYSTGGPFGVTAEITTSDGGGGGEIHAYVASAVTGSSRPGVVLVHHMPGWDEFYFECAERLARHGYDVICPDLYCRFGHGLPDDVYAKVRSEGGVHDDSVVADATAAAQWLRAQPTHNGRVGVMGTCSGGRHALLVASMAPEFDAVVDMWGGGVVAAKKDATPARPVAPVEYTAQLSAPLLGLFGNDDPSCSPRSSRRRPVASADRCPRSVRVMRSAWCPNLRLVHHDSGCESRRCADLQRILRPRTRLLRRAGGRQQQGVLGR